MFLNISDAAELPHELQALTIAPAAATDEVNDVSLSDMTHAIPLLAQAPTQIDVFKVHKECFVQSPQLLQQRSSDHQACPVRPIDILGLRTIDCMRRCGGRLHGRG